VRRGSVCYAQAADAAHAQLRVDDGRLVGADPAGSGVVAVGAQVLVQVRGPLLVVVTAGPGSTSSPRQSVGAGALLSRPDP
jgi:hypothetical protein